MTRAKWQKEICRSEEGKHPRPASTTKTREIMSEIVSYQLTYL